MTIDLILKAVEAQAVHMIEAAAIVGVILEGLKRLRLDVGNLPKRWQPLPAIVVNVGLLLWFARSDGLAWGVAAIVAVVNGAFGGLTSVGAFHTVKRLVGGWKSGDLEHIEKGPDAEPPTTLRSMGTAALVLLVATGCAGSFEEARVAGIQARAVSSQKAPTDYCQGLDSQRRWWGGIGQGSALLAGAQGLATIPVKNDRAELGLAIGTATVAAGAVVATWVSEDAGAFTAATCQDPKPTPPTPPNATGGAPGTGGAAGSGGDGTGGAPVDDCDAAGRRLKELQCTGNYGEPLWQTPSGTPFAEVCRRREVDGDSVCPRCLRGIRDCSEITACHPTKPGECQ